MMALTDNIELFIFDLDGTLIDSKQDVSLAVNAGLRSAGLPEASQSELSHLLDRGLSNILQALIPDMALYDGIFSAFTEHYQQHLLDNTTLYPGTLDVLDRLRGKTLAIASNKRHRFCQDILQGLDILDRFKVVVGGDTVGVKKPDPKPLLHVAQLTDQLARHSVMIGDSPVDILAAKAAGMQSVGLTAGFTSGQLVTAANPDLILARVSDLLQYID